MKTVVITGGTRGLGKALVYAYAKEGHTVIFNYHSSRNHAEKIIEDITQKYGIRSKAYACDVSNADDVARFCKEVVSEFNSIDILINNAGITNDKLILQMKDDDFDKVVQTNLMGTYYMIKGFTRMFLKQKQGVILNMSSVIGLHGNVGQANYAASKAGVIGLTKSVAKEFASKNIRVNALAPGFIQTEMTDILTEEQKKSIQSQIPLGNLGTTEDVVAVACFLTSDAASYMTGQIISVDGGINI